MEAQVPGARGGDRWLVRLMSLPVAAITPRDRGHQLIL